MKLLVLGATGFLGRHLLSELKRHEQWDIRAVSSDDCDLCSEEESCGLFSGPNYDVIIHLAAIVGGIGANDAAPATFWEQNLRMGMTVLNGCRKMKARLILIGTTCSYPKIPKTIPFLEEEMFDGMPELTNSPYGIAKRTLHVGAMAYQKQFGLKFITLVPTNMFGPGDNFDANTSHVIPALIRKFVEAKREKKKIVTLWGTGKPTRDFLYVEDCAQAIARAVERPEVDKVSLVNLGSGREISIARLASLVQRFVGYMGDIDWDLTKPDGQPRRVLDIQRAERWLDWKATTSLEEGLKKTVEWYVAQEAVKA